MLAISTEEINHDFFFSFILSTLSKIEWNVSAKICFDFYGNFLPTKVQWPSISAHFYLIFYAINLRRKRNSKMQLRHATLFNATGEKAWLTLTDTLIPWNTAVQCFSYLCFAVYSAIQKTFHDYQKKKVNLNSLQFVFLFAMDCDSNNFVAIRLGSFIFWRIFQSDEEQKVSNSSKIILWNTEIISFEFLHPLRTLEEFSKTFLITFVFIDKNLLSLLVWRWKLWCLDL